MARYHADLHLHSTASDGTDAPADVVRRAAAKGLRAMALTDHDTVAGIAEAQAAGAELGVEVIAGVELTCYAGKREVHMLGYGVNPRSKALRVHCERFQTARIGRAREIGKRLAAAGAPINMDQVMASADGGVVGRPHIAKALLAAGHVASWQEAFDRFLADNAPANVPKLLITPRQCIDVIREAGGIAVMAHPGLNNQLDLIPLLREAGCEGIEVWHSNHDEHTTYRLQVMALEQGLLATGGSDCHGEMKDGGPLLGDWGLGKAGWEKVEKALRDRKDTPHYARR